MFHSVLRAIRASAASIVRAWEDAEEVWDLHDPLLSPPTSSSRPPLGIYD